MNDHQIFATALGIAEPWNVKQIEFKPEGTKTLALHIYLDFRPGTLFPCPDCGAMSKLHDTEDKTWRHLNFFQHETYIHARVPRTNCIDHKIKQVAVHWARPGSGFSLLFEAMILRMVKYLPVAALAREIGEHDTRIWRVIEHYVNKAEAVQDLSDTRYIGVDETANKRGHDYVTIVADLDSRRVIHVSEGKGKDCIQLFSNHLEARKGSVTKVQEVTIDMSRSFIAGVKEYLPNAAITFDKFHIMKQLNDALGEVWRVERGGVFSFKRTKFTWLKNPENLSEKQQIMLEGLLKLTTKTGRAYRLKLAFQELYKLQGDEGVAGLRKWCAWAVRSRLEPMKRFAQMIKNHWNGITRWFYSGINNGILEGLNSLIQSAKARARGFRTFEKYRIMILLTVGQLNLQPI